jgi:hypothetical protein
MSLPAHTTDKHDYVLFDCPDCPRKAKLAMTTVRAYLGSRGPAGILRMVYPNDCRELPCGWRFKPPVTPGG